MTKRERAQVVELLRCAADRLSPASTGAWTDALEWLDTPLGVEMAAAMAFNETAVSMGAYTHCEGGRAVYLEAAARVELEEWP